MGLRAALLRFFELRPVRACFLGLAPLLELPLRPYLALKRALTKGDLDLEKASPIVDRADVELEALPESEKARLERWLAERLLREGALERTVGEALAHAAPPAKQRFFGWVEDRSFEDEHAVAYAEAIFDGLRRRIERHRGALEGLRILELGPGYTLTAGLLFYAHGARSYTGADLFPIAGRDSALYRRLRLHLSRSFVLPVSSINQEILRRFDEAVKLDGPEAVFDETKVSCRHPVDAASLPFPDASFDVVLSLASFEHFQDPAAAARECARVTAPGGVGLHQIDLRDHRDFSKPLDFLRYSDEEWRKIPPKPFCYTNRLRKSDFERVFRDSGVSVEDADVNLKTTLDPALRAQLHPSFRDRPIEELEAISTFFVLRKSSAPATAGDRPRSPAPT
jgi:SAM-dependent methyltransferase